MRNLQRPSGLETFSLSSYLITHKKIRTGGEPCRCKSVRELPSNAYSSPSQKIRTRGQCHWCEQCFRHYAQLTGCQKAHMGETPAKCGKSFPQNYDFLTHQRSHIGKILGICLECGKSIRWRVFLGLQQQNSLRRDLMKSLSEKSCQWSAPLVHQGTHTSEKNRKYLESE